MHLRVTLDLVVLPITRGQTFKEFENNSKKPMIGLSESDTAVIENEWSTFLEVPIL